MLRTMFIVCLNSNPVNGKTTIFGMVGAYIAQNKR